MTQEFFYKAVKPSGESLTGFHFAASRADLLSQLLERDLFLLRANRVRRSRRRSGARPDWALLERLSTIMVQLLRSGMPLADALELLAMTAERRVASVGHALLQRVRSGQSMSQASAAETSTFGHLYPRLFALGEASGDMQAVFEEILQSVRWQRRLSARLQNVLTYPLMVLLLMCGVMLFLLLAVVPQLVQFVQSVQHVLPWHTIVLFSLSNVLQQYWLAGATAVFLLAVCCVSALHYSARWRNTFDSFVLRLPLLGTLSLKLKFSRYFHALALLLRSHLDLLSVLQSAGPTLANTALESAVSTVAQRVSTGSLLSPAMQSSGVFPERVWRMVAAGEQSGELATLFQHLGELHDDEIRASINRIEQFLPPCLIALVGLILMWMIVSVLGPLYDTVLGTGALLL